MEAWAATSSWRGDLKFFGRVIQRARDEVRGLGCPDTCCIEFAVGNGDVERFKSVEDMLALVPSHTLRSFSSARVRIGSESLSVEIRFGRGLELPFGLERLKNTKPAFACPPGIAIEATSSGAVGREDLESVRDAVAAAVTRGGFFWANKPARGPLPAGPGLDQALAQRWKMREFSAQAVFLGVAAGLLLVLVAVNAFARAHHEPFSPLLSEWPFVLAVAVVAQLVSFSFATQIFPAIDIADITPGRRILQVIGRSGVLTTVVGLVAKGIFSV